MKPPAWFTMYMWMELLYHVPLSVWAIGALLRSMLPSSLMASIDTLMFATDDSKLPIHLLIYAVQTAITTSTCIADYLSWSSITSAQKIELGKLYVPYLALCKLLTFVKMSYANTSPTLAVFMTIDMYARLDALLRRKHEAASKKQA